MEKIKFSYVLLIQARTKLFTLKTKFNKVVHINFKLTITKITKRYIYTSNFDISTFSRMFYRSCELHVFEIYTARIKFRNFLQSFYFFSVGMSMLQITHNFNYFLCSHRKSSITHLLNFFPGWFVILTSKRSFMEIK